MGVGRNWLIPDATRINVRAVGNVANTDGFLMKAGSTYATAIDVGAVAGKFLNFYLKSSVTTGAVIGNYTRVYATGAGAGVTLNAGRFFATVYDVAIGNATGAHISLNFNASGSITGLGTGSRSTLHVPNVVMSGGTYAGAQSEVYFDGTTARIAGATVASIHRFIVDGVSSHTNDVPYVFEFVGLNSTQWETTYSDTPDRALKIRVNGTAYWIACSTATT